jgi:hypothetical protein
MVGMSNAYTMGLRSVAIRERNIGHPELAGIIDGAADAIDRLQQRFDLELDAYAKDSDMAELRAHNKRLTKELAQVSSQSGDSVELQEAEQHGFMRGAAGLKADNERLRAALKPFVRAAGFHCIEAQDDESLQVLVKVAPGLSGALTVKDFRRARSAYQQQMKAES